MASTWVPRASRKESQRVSTCGGQNIWQNGHSNRSNAIVLLPKPTPRCWPSASCYAHFTTTKKCRNLLGVAIAPNFYLFSPNLSVLHTQFWRFYLTAASNCFFMASRRPTTFYSPGVRLTDCVRPCVYAHRSKGSRHIGPTFPLVGHTRTSVPVCVLRRCQPKKRKISFFFFSSLRPAGESCDVPVYSNNFRAKKDKAFPVRALVIHQITRMAQPKK